MLGTSYPPQVFLGLHFVLFGFDPVSESKVRFKLINGGGVDVGHYSPSCTHVIVGKLAYDDPVCVSARNDGKTLVTALWVDHSADIGMSVDAASVMYRPLKDLNGIPGAKNLIVCLTGYQRQDRDDIMTMVGLMGAQFSKPLVANKVSHLICYKFEGEKYELAKRLKTIKLVNHRWLEDCLKDWVLLPEDKYNKSGYELEMMAAEAKDSEEEAEDHMPGQSGGRNLIKSPVSSKISTATTHKLSKSAREAANAFPDSTAPEGSLKVNKGHETHDSFIPEYENRSDQALCFHHVDDLKISCQDSGVSRHVASGQLPETYVKTTKPRNTNVPKAVDCQDLGMPGNAIAFGTGTSEFGKLVNDLGLTPESAEGLEHSDAKVNAMSCSRKYIKRFSLPRNENESSGNISSPSLDDMKFVNNLETSSSKGEKASDRISFPCVEGSGKGNDFIDSREPISLLPQKRTIETSTKPESKMTADAKLSIERIPSPNGITQGLKLTSLINEPPETEDYFSVGKDAIKNRESVSSKSMQCDDAYQNSAQTAVRSLSESKINGKPNIACLGMREVAHNGIETNPPNAENDIECLYPGNKKYQNEEPTGLSTLNLCNKVTDELIRKLPRRKTVAKKCLGSRRKLGATAKQKDLISLNESSPQCDSVSCFSGCKETVTCDGKKLHTSSRIVGTETSLEQENVRKSAENAGGREFLDDMTELPDNCGYELGIALDEKKAELVHTSKKADAPTEQKMEAIHHITKCKEAMPAKKGTNGTEQKVLELVDSTSKVKEKNKGRKLPAGRTNKTTVAKDLMRSKEAVCEVKMDNKRKDKTEMASLEKVSLSAVQNDRSTIPTNNSENFLKVEKENRPIDGEKDIGEGISIRNSAIKSSVGPAKINQKDKKTAITSSISEDNKRVKREAACFILSGHRLQRKEFQQIIRRLKGRVCRDSHQWSYQATHFIAPDPIRRTEKFFAATASGRWVLKTDYLTACSQAGKFLAEEPFEWHKNGLSEDGAINMGAPRRWRLLKERTGHGAFYGMRIIIYGDCFAPPLDTLKCVVKAGDGTILATSPPYTRFLDTAIDYAIVSPGMPRVDLWVQEFLKHEIPCVLADYLVEYVCKPGFSLERHVLYGTHAWAERSFANLQRRAEEMIEIPLENCEDDNDAACQLCGSRDRGDVMLICGDESGSIGCGIGIHIDCCDPPLKDVPEEDWFCPKCSGTRNCSNSPRKRKKGVSSLSNSK